LMQVPDRKIACRWSSESAVDAGFPVEAGREEANHAHPEQQPAARVNGWRLHLPPARPHFGSGRWSYFSRRAAIVNRGLGVEGKKEHQGAERDGHRAPQLLVLHDSTIQTLFCLTRGFRIRTNPTPLPIIRARLGLVSGMRRCDRRIVLSLRLGAAAGAEKNSLAPIGCSIRNPGCS